MQGKTAVLEAVASVVLKQNPEKEWTHSRVKISVCVCVETAVWI